MIFSNVKSLTIPEGKAVKMSDANGVIWSAGRIPSEYQEVEYVGRTREMSVTYIDLGFAFDTGATIYIDYQSLDTQSTQPFGAAENSGKYRCMISEGSGVVYGYGSNGSSYINQIINRSNNRMVLKYTIKPQHLQIEDLISGQGSTASEKNVAFTMTSNLALFGQHYNGNYRSSGTFNIYSFKYYDKNDNLICDLVPCYRKSDGEIGMYDIVRKMFLVNQGAGKFIKGADI